MVRIKERVEILTCCPNGQDTADFGVREELKEEKSGTGYQKSHGESRFIHSRKYAWTEGRGGIDQAFCWTKREELGAEIGGTHLLVANARQLYTRTESWSKSMWHSKLPLWSSSTQ